MGDDIEKGVANEERERERDGFERFSENRTFYKKIKYKIFSLKTDTIATNFIKTLIFVWQFVTFWTQQLSSRSKSSNFRRVKISSFWVSEKTSQLPALSTKIAKPIFENFKIWINFRKSGDFIVKTRENRSSVALLIQLMFPQNGGPPTWSLNYSKRKVYIFLN